MSSVNETKFAQGVMRLRWRVLARDRGAAFRAWALLASAAVHPDTLKFYKGTSLTRKCTPLGPYRKPIPGVLGESKTPIFVY